ncbi:MAG: endolytic transglycosylase MltG [Candidatus Gracilibacteria bacterium]|jgi:UPF0755 protein
MMTRTRKIVILLVVLVLIPVLYGYLKYTHDINYAVDPKDDTEIAFQIKKGQTAREVAGILEKQGLITNSGTFYLYMRFNNLGEKMIAGRFFLKKSMTTKEVARTITDAKNAEAILTIQEGLRTNDIDKKLSEMGLIQQGDFITATKNFDGWQYYSFLDKDTLSKLEIPIEGYIYPDTYFLNSADFKPTDLIYRAMDNFENKFKDLQSKIKRHTINEIITMASIIENEVYGAENRKIVSGILWKRLDSRWKLDADATVLYITADREITSEDLEIDSPYNTRKNGGLPPGPICNPSIESIEAAMYPTESDYWFYLTDPKTGEVVYAKTNEEQNINRQNHL